MRRFLCVQLVFLWISFAWAKPSQTDLIDGLPPAAPPPAKESVEVRAHAIGKKLRCPVCQGLSIADSNAEGAVMIQRRINELVAAGYTEEQIQDYFIDKYGEWILLEPKPEGINLVVWLAPAIASALGLLALARTSRENDRNSPPPSHVSSTSYEEQLLKELNDDF